MKFYKYLNEELNTDTELYDFLTTLKKECGTYLKNFKGDYSDTFLMSGRPDNNPFIKKKIRKDRMPLDTPRELHDLMDSVFKEEFGFKARSESMFCWSSRVDETTPSYNTYGDLYLIFPVGDYDLLYGEKVTDLFNEVSLIIHYAFGKFDTIDGKDVRYNTSNWSLKKMLSNLNQEVTFYREGSEKTSRVYKAKEIHELLVSEIGKIIKTKYTKVKNGKAKNVGSVTEIMLHCDYVYMLRMEYLIKNKEKLSDIFGYLFS